MCSCACGSKKRGDEGMGKKERNITEGRVIQLPRPLFSKGKKKHLVSAIPFYFCNQNKHTPTHSYASKTHLSYGCRNKSERTLFFSLFPSFVVVLHPHHPRKHCLTCWHNSFSLLCSVFAIGALRCGVSFFFSFVYVVLSFCCQGCALLSFLCSL